MSAERPLSSQQPMPLPRPSRALRLFCPAIWCTHLAGAHAAASNQDTAAMRRPTENKESR